MELSLMITNEECFSISLQNNRKLGNDYYGIIYVLLLWHNCYPSNLVPTSLVHVHAHSHAKPILFKVLY